MQSRKQHLSFDKQSESFVHLSTIKQPGNPTDLGHSFGTLSIVVLTMINSFGLLPIISIILLASGRGVVVEDVVVAIVEVPVSKIKIN